jgi:cell division protein FtsN
VVAVLAVVLRYSTPEHLATPDSESSHPVRTSAPGVEPSAPAPPPAVTVIGRERQASPPTVSGEAQSGAEPARVRPGSAGSTRSESGIAPTEPARPASVHSRFALEVASFIFEERARQERDRLAAAGLHARVVTTLEFGSRVYRVVIGGYPQPAAAERAADSLLSNGVVLQARVITTGGAR